MYERIGIMCVAPMMLLLAWSCTVQAADLQQPRVETALAGHVPSDAIVLFDGTNLDEWTDTSGNPSKWIVADGAMQVNGGGIMTKREFGDMQLHLEFCTPSKVEGSGQGRGNSGVYLQGIYELQVLDSYDNETYPNGMAGALYMQYIPLVNVSRQPGVWQTYNIIFRAPVFNASGAIVRRAILTVLHNGVLIQDHVEIAATPGGVREKESPTGPIFLQDHQCPIRYRNIWIREL